MYEFPSKAWELEKNKLYLKPRCSNVSQRTNNDKFSYTNSENLQIVMI